MQPLLWTLFAPFGRADRSLFVTGCGALIVVSVVATVLSHTLDQVYGSLRFPLLIAPILLVAWCGFCLLSNRLHDLGQSGLWALGPVVLAGAYSAATVAGEHVTLGMLVFLFISAAVVAAVYIAFAIALLFFPGDPGPNRFGARSATNA
ncbi:MAG TPA: DUF805 domain-containing protein [Caulobacterales bacterium]|nr:DUF805 domain-containing protein [Caulobacterales bacterium]